ncbi:hypothetical protein ABPG77_004746 [Micractinium sp. CCAP 211/92]
MRFVTCSALLLISLAAAPAAAARLPLLGLQLDICETFGHDACLEHADKCTPCLAWGKVNTCFETSIAKKLPPKLFECDFAPPSPPPTPPPTTDCGSLSEEGTCEEAHGCVWCISAAVPSACYTEAEAKRLPAAVFKCDFPSLAEQ